MGTPRLAPVVRAAALTAAAMLVALLAAVTAGCASGSTDGVVTTPSGPELPAYARVNAWVQAGYEHAMRSPALLEQMPCYCGCVNQGHRHLRDCYIGDDGAFTDHAAFCTVCLDESADVMAAAEAGKSPAEIRAQIDATYGDLGAPTDTPPVD